MSIIDILDRPLMAQLRLAQSGCETAIVALGEFSVGHQTDALCGGERVNIRHVQLFLEGFGHAGKAQRVKLIECGMG